MGLVMDRLVSEREARQNGFQEYDVARNYKQAMGIARGYPPDMPSVVGRTGEKGDVFPYTIFVIERFGDKNATKKMKRRFKL